MTIMRKMGAAAAGAILVLAVGCTSEEGSSDPDGTTTTVVTETVEPGVPEVGLDDVRDAFADSGDEYGYAELTDDPTLDFDPDELGAVEAGQIDFMMDCGVSTIEIYVFDDAEAAQVAADEMEARIEAFSCAAPDEEGDVEMASLHVGVNENVVGVSESSSYVADFEDLDLGGGSPAT
jgi:hypothetical protein